LTPTPVPVNPTIPLAANVREAYQDLYEKLEDAIENTEDPATLKVLNSSQNNVDNVLTKDDKYRLHEDTALFEALHIQIDNTNTELDKLRDQIHAIAADFAMAADVLAAITKVLTLVPKP
jgi:hypothetical protein